MSLTIIIPVYNTADFLPKCLNALLNEERSKLLIENNISILAVNDGSTDDSLNVLEEYQSKFPNIISILSQENQGLSVARNNAMKHLTTDFFAFVDSDDWIDLEKFIKVYKIAIEKKLEAIIYRLDFYDENNQKISSNMIQSVTFNQVLPGIKYLDEGYQPSSVCLMIFNTKFVKENELYYYPGITQQDVEYTIRFFLKAKRILFIDEIIYHYFRRSGSTTIPKTKKKLEKYLSDSIIVAEQIKKNENYSSSNEVKQLIQKNYNSVVWNLLWRFYKNPNEVDSKFREKCISDLKEKDLYPIKGSLKTRFQNIIRVFMNNSLILKKIIIGNE